MRTLSSQTVYYDHHIPVAQHPHTRTECAIRNVHIENVTCTGENAMGVYGANGNIREVELCNIDYTRKPSANIVLKGYAFDFSPSKIDFEVPADCGLYIGGKAEVKLDNMRMHQWSIIQE